MKKLEQITCRALQECFSHVIATTLSGLDGDIASGPDKKRF